MAVLGTEFSINIVPHILFFFLNFLQMWSKIYTGSFDRAAFRVHPFPVICTEAGKRQRFL